MTPSRDTGLFGQDILRPQGNTQLGLDLGEPDPRDEADVPDQMKLLDEEEKEKGEA